MKSSTPVTRLTTRPTATAGKDPAEGRQRNVAADAEQAEIEHPARADRTAIPMV